MTALVLNSLARRPLAFAGGGLLLVVLGLVLAPWVVTRLRASAERVTVTSLDEVAAASPRERGPPAPVRILTWNIAHGRGLAESNWRGGEAAEREARLHAIADEIRKSAADVVVLNEVDFDSSWSGRVDHARLLAERAGYPYVVEQRNLDFAVGPFRWAFGNAVLSRIPVTRAELIDLEAHAGWEELLVGKKSGVEVSFGEPWEEGAFRLAAVHLEHRQESVRVQGAHQVAIRTYGATPLVVAGDLNSAPPGDPAHQTDELGRNALAALRLGAGLSGPETGKTFPADGPRFAIDWILAPEDALFLRYDVGDVALSDHRPVAADIVLAPGAR